MKRIRVEEIDGVIYIDGIDIIKKLSELSKENDRLYLENKRQKEDIDKIKDLLTIKKSRCLNENDYILNALDLDEILDILKEVEE